MLWWSCSTYSNILFLLLYFCNRLKLSQSLKSLYFFSLIFPVPCVFASPCWLASLGDASANQSLLSLWPLHWLVNIQKGDPLLETEFSQVLLLFLARWLSVGGFYFAASDHFLLFLYIAHFYTITFENLVEKEVLRESCVRISRLITALRECDEFRTLRRWNVFSLFHLFSVTASSTCEKLEKARNDLQIAYEGFVQKLNQQHQTDLSELENRLKEFYTGECEKFQNIYIEEAEKYKTQLQEQVCAFGAWACYWSWPCIQILIVGWGTSFELLFI